MNRISIGHVVRVTIAFVLLVVVSNVVAVSAQGSNSPFDQILAKLDQIIEALTPPPADPVVKLVTSAVAVGSTQFISCSVVNVGTENVEGVLRVIGPDGVIDESSVLTLEPGSGANNFDPGPGFRWCDFTFAGTASSVRANLLLRNDADQETVDVVEMR